MHTDKPGFDEAMSELSILASFHQCEEYAERNNAHLAVAVVVEVLAQEGMASPSACVWVEEFRSPLVSYQSMAKLFVAFKLKFKEAWRMRNDALHSWH